MSSSQHTVLAWMSTRRRPRLPLLLLGIAVCCALWLLFAAHRLDYVADDAFILFRHVLQHSRGLGMMFDPGHPVQAHSSVAWAYLLRLGVLVGFSIEDSARFLGPLFAVFAVLSFTVLLWSKLNMRRLLIALLCFVSFPPLVLWASGGLETPLALWLALFFVNLVGHGCEADTPEQTERERFKRWMGAVLVGVVSPFVRLDLPLQLLCGLLCLFVFLPRTRKQLPVVFLAFALGIAAHVAVHRMTYGAALAVPVATKFRIEPRNLLRYGRYVLQDAPQLVPLGVLLLHLLWKNGRQVVRQDPVVLLSLGVGAAAVLEAALLGGDELSRGRFLMFPFAFGLLAVFRLLQGTRFPKGKRYGILLSLFLLSAAQTGWALSKEGDQPCSTFRRAAGVWLSEHTTPDFSIAVAPAGYIPFFADRSTVDLMGLAHPKIGRLTVERGSEAWGEAATEIAIAENVCAVLLVVCDSPIVDPREHCEHKTLRGIVAALRRHPEYQHVSVGLEIGKPLRFAVSSACLGRIKLPKRLL
ncbi:MAG TPA: hypothetical protein PKE31_09870 [Pseudomonadota bacterium]|nr:hypothetical protein [Pseudomonadota bacterium]